MEIDAQTVNVEMNGLKQPTRIVAIGIQQQKGGRKV